MARKFYAGISALSFACSLGLVGSVTNGAPLLYMIPVGFFLATLFLAGHLADWWI